MKHPKWLKIKYEEMEQAEVIEDTNPFEMKVKWKPPDGVVLMAALSFFVKQLKKGYKGDALSYMAVAAEAFGVPADKRIPSDKQLERISRQIFAILTKNNKRKMEQHMSDLIFWKDFKGGFIHATHSPTY